MDKLKEDLGNIDMSWEAIHGKPETFPATKHSHSWGTITNKPTEFQPIDHTHTKAQITTSLLHYQLMEEMQILLKI